MKIKALRPTTVQTKGWLRERFGDCVSQISTDGKLRLRSSTKDVFRFLYGVGSPQLLEASKLTNEFPMVPQGVEDQDFVFGYKGSDGDWIPGAIESDPVLQKFVKTYPKEWTIIEQCLGMTRQKGRHACHPAGVLISVIGPDMRPMDLEIEKCDKAIVRTGQGSIAEAILLDQGVQEVWEFTLSDGKVFRATPDHKLLTTVGWRTAEQVMTEGLDLVINEENFPLKH